MKSTHRNVRRALKRCPGIVRGFFGDPKLAYIRA